MCSFNASCKAAVFYHSTCWLKQTPSAPSYSEGRVTCWRSGHGPIPPPPPPTPPPPPPSYQNIEEHGPYQHGAGFPSMNGALTPSPFDPRMPISFPRVATGPTYKNLFASEFGCVGMSSFESMSSLLAESHWSAHGGAPPDTCENFDAHWNRCQGDNVMAQRNYPCDNIVAAYFGPQQNLNLTGEAAFKRQLYQCKLGQALEMKADLEKRRSHNYFGLLVWSLNEIWPTGGWGSLEYGTPLPGQVLGGRWKPLHYLYRRSLFADVMATCGDHGACYIKNDAVVPFTGTVEVDAIRFADGKRSKVRSLPVALAAGAGISEALTIVLDATFNGNTSMLELQVVSDKGEVRV